MVDKWRGSSWGLYNFSHFSSPPTKRTIGDLHLATERKWKKSGNIIICFFGFFSSLRDSKS